MSTDTEKTPRAIVYVRLSSLREDSASVSPAEQEERCRAFALAKGWEVTEVISDLDVSGSAKGKRLERAGLKKVREALPEVDYVIARSIDRLARNVVDFMTLAEEAAEHGAALATVKESLDLSTPGGRFTATILAAFAEMEAETISARIRDGREGMRRAQRWGGGFLPFGYKSAPVDPDNASEGRILVPNPDEAAAVRRGAELILSGMNIWNACKALDDEGHKPRKAEGWHYTSLRNALTSDAVLGRLRHAGKTVRDEHGSPVVAFDPILSREDFERLRAILLDGNRRTQKGNVKAAGREITPTTLLGGLAVCDSCGRRLYSTWGTRKIKGETVKVQKYGCSNATCDQRVTIAEHLIEPFVTEEFLRRFGIFAHVEVREVARDIGALADIEEALREAGEAITARGADRAAIGARIDELSAERDRLEAKPTEAGIELVESGKTIREVWDEGDLLTRRGLLTGAITELRVTPGVRGRKGRDDSRVKISYRSG